MASIKARRYILGISWILLNRQLVQACIFGSHPGCSFPCNCDNNDVCDETTGACPGACRQGQPRPAGNEAMFDWRGPGCKIGNVALRKPATQSGTFYDAGNAVDGEIRGNEWEVCAQTFFGTSNAWWRVDLQGQYNIISITIFNTITLGHRTGYFNIRVGNSLDLSNNALCVYYAGPVPNGGSVTLSCTSNLVGRYVSMARTGGGTDPYVINICEMVVMGHKSVVASCARCVSSCDNIVGCRKCTGFKPPHCTTPCEAGRYGINCESSCSEHHCEGGSTSCNNMNGGCPDGCQDWYLGDQCITHIKEPSLLSQTAISGTAVNSSQVRVTWGRDDDVIANLAQYYGYLVQYKTNNDSDYLPGPTVSHVPGEAEYSAIIRELIHNTVYTLRVSMYRQHGELYEVSPWPTREVMVKTSCQAPDPVSILKISTGAIVEVEWQSAPSGCDSIASIHVLYRRVGADEWATHDVMDPTTSTSVSIADVTGAQWEVKVRVFNNENISSESMSEGFTVPEHAPTDSYVDFNTAPITSVAESTAEPSITVGDGSRDYKTQLRLTISLATIFGISALVSVGFILRCIWRKIQQKRNKAPLTMIYESPKEDITGHYAGLVRPMSTAPEGLYDELHMDERRASVEPGYEQPNNTTPYGREASTGRV